MLPIWWYQQLIELNTTQFDGTNHELINHLLLFMVLPIIQFGAFPYFMVFLLINQFNTSYSLV